jgi:hypothetical protein
MLPNFRAAFGAPSPDGLGDTHEIAIALMTDLHMAGAAGPWTYVYGRLATYNGVMEHSWLEFDGWAVDASNGQCLIIPVALYREKGTPHRTMDVAAFQRWMSSGAPEVVSWEPEVVSREPGVLKVGRNAPCPCGSGAKFKKCCCLKN